MDVAFPGTPRAVPQQHAPERHAPRQQVPGTAAALPVAETALRQVLAGLGSSVDAEDTAAVALSLLRSVEALLRTSAPAGTSATELGAAAARLIERQGLIARLSGQSGGTPTPADWSTSPGAPAPAAVDTRL